MREQPIQESVTHTDHPKVDREKGMIYDVLLLGPVSRNGYVYPESTRKKALSLFEGAKSNLSHLEDRSLKGLAKAPDFGKRIGKVMNVRDTHLGIRGDFKYLRSHPWSPVLQESAEDFPDAFGFSFQGAGVWDKKDSEGRWIVEEITKVKSVDLVTDSGTTSSLFEDNHVMEEKSREGAISEASETPEEELCSAEDLMCEVISALARESKHDFIPHAIRLHKKIKGEDGEESSEDSDVTETSEETEMKEELTELEQLKLEKEVRLLIEDANLDYSESLASLLEDLPTAEKREKHLNYLKRTSKVKAVKTQTTKPITQSQSDDALLTLLRGGQR